MLLSTGVKVCITKMRYNQLVCTMTTPPAATGRPSRASQKEGHAMTPDIDEIAKRVGDLRHAAGVPVEPARRGPVQLNRFFLESSLRHVALPNLSFRAVADRLRRPDLVGDDAPHDPGRSAFFLSGTMPHSLIDLSALALANVLPSGLKATE